jgi:hypothetical protein
MELSEAEGSVLKFTIQACAPIGFLRRLAWTARAAKSIAAKAAWRK